MLSEPRIQRYARQILLRDVGGVGQEALGAVRVRFPGRGALVDAARTYLRAGGTVVEPGATDGAWAADAPLVDAAATEALHVGTLSDDLAPPCVLLGATAGALALWSAGAEVCPECLRARAPASAAPEPEAGPAAVIAGAMLALLVQRRLLGLAPPLEGLSVAPSGRVQRLEAPRCPHHPPPLAPGVLATVLDHLGAVWPEEGCGVLLAGEVGTRFLPLPNAQAAHHARDPLAFPRAAHRAFTIDPARWLSVLKEAEGRSEEVVALVHSHPEGPAHLSDEDRRQAAPDDSPLYPAMAHLVVAFRNARPTEACWALWKAGGFQEVACPLPDRKEA